MYLQRLIEPTLRDIIAQGKSILLLGARQTGKTTLLKHLGVADLTYSLLDPELRLRFEKSPGLLGQEIKAYTLLHKLHRLPIVIIDEVQKIPALMDAIQLLIDDHVAQFILTGSSMTKLRRHAQFNLLPGRVINFHLDPLSLPELNKPLPELETLLTFGSLPGIFLETITATKELLLDSYVKNYLEEEVRGEALVRHLGSFARFLEIAAMEAGKQINIHKLSQDLGVGRHIITEYFKVLEDCLIAEKIPAITNSTTRKRLTKASKYLFVDLGLRRVAAGEGTTLSDTTAGPIFEQFVGTELLRLLRLRIPAAKLGYWRDHAGPEVDYVIEYNKQYCPIEVKWTKTPTLRDARHLFPFINEYPCDLPAYIICRTEKPLLLHPQIIALPWQELETVIVNLM